LACGRFYALLAQGRDVDTFQMEGDVVTRTALFAKISPSIGIGTDAVMDMQSGELPGIATRQMMHDMQQYDGIHPAAERNEYRTIRGNQRG
jgi:hypothetical protein